MARVARAGFFHVFGASVVNKLVAFLANILVVRFMAKDDYGLFSYANSIYAIAMLFTGLGMVSAVLVYCAERRPDGEKARYYRYGLTRGLAADAAIVVVLFAVALLAAFPLEDAGLYVAMLAPMLLVDYVFQFESICLRSRKENRRFSYLQVAQSVLYGALSCLGAYLGGIAGLIAGRYAAYAVSVIVGALLLRGLGLGIRGAGTLSREEAGGMWRYSVENGAAGIMNQLVFLLDVIVVGQVLANAAQVAYYKVATMLPEGFLFVPGSVMVFAMPYFIEHNADPAWFRRNAARLSAGVEAVMAAFAAALILFAPQVIEVLWGADYLESALPFRIISATLLVTPLRQVCTNLLGALRLTRENLVISVATLVVNVSLVAVLTVVWGIVGAAMAVLATCVVAAAVSAAILFAKVGGRAPAS